MAHQSLYRRYRPRRFSDVRGQEHVIRALRNAVREDRVGHAYLFSGPRGTGKTSTARILAKALNCENVVDGEPDGTCESCLAIDAGTSYDVQELDAASNNSVGDMRELISRVALGSPGRTKVYILDEVHMLSGAAAAALLKTLEEPPGHVVFVLATTDPQKVLPTIRSRTQHYDFHLLTVEELREHVAWVIHDAELGLPDSVIDHVVRAGAGSARDTLSELDQVAAAGGVIDDGQPVEAMIDAIAASDVGAALLATADAISSGRDPRILGENVLGRLRDIFLLRMGGGTQHLAPGDLERVQTWADQLGDRATTRALEAIGDALLEMRQAPDPRIPLEVALVKITKVEADGSLDGLTARVAALEAALAAGGTAAAPAAQAGGSGSGAGRSASTPAPQAAPEQRGGAASSGRPAPPPRPGGRPADAVRAKLAAGRGSNDRPAQQAPARPPASGPSSPSGPSSAPPAPGPSSPDAPTSGAPSSAPTRAPATSPPPADLPASAAAGPASAPSGAASSQSPPTPESLTAIWNESVLPSLGGLAKAMYSVGRFTEVQGSTAVMAFPNEVHREKCEQKRSEVEAALAKELAAPVTLRLVVDGNGGVRHDGAPADLDRDVGGDEPPDDVDALGGHDVHDLDDAPDAPTGGLDALTEAFPGSELIDGS